MAFHQTGDPETEPTSGAGFRVPARDSSDDPLAQLESPRAKLVYLALWTTGGSTVDDLKTTLGFPKLTLLRVLGELTADGIVERDGERYVAGR